MHVGSGGRFNEHIFIILRAGERKNTSEMLNFAFDPEVCGQPGGEISLLILVQRLRIDGIGPQIHVRLWREILAKRYSAIGESGGLEDGAQHNLRMYVRQRS